MVSPQPELTVFFAMESFLGLFSGNETVENFGGAEVKMSALAKGLAKTGRVEVILLTEHEVFDTGIPHIQVRKIEMPITRGVPGVSRIINAKRAERTFSHTTKDVVLMTSQIENVYIIETAKRQGIPTVYRINADSLVDNSSLVTPEWRQFVEKRMRAVDHLITQSLYQKENLQANFGLDSTIMESLCSFPEREYVPSQKNLILWVGRCVTVKRPWVVLTLAQLRPQYKFVMASPKEEPYLSAAVYEEAALLENLTVYNGTSRQDTLDLYEQARLVLSTSWSEAIASTLIEASVTSTPYISYKVDFDESIQEAGIAHCAQNNLDTLLEMLDKFMTDSEYCMSEAQKAHAYALARWNEEKIVNDHINYFLKISKWGGAHGTQN